MDFQIIDVDLDHKPEDLAVMNPYNQVPVLVERDLVLHESNIINEYIDERFPHPQLMPADPVMRARARLFLHGFEQELFIHIEALEGNNQKNGDKARAQVRDSLLQIAPVLRQAQAHARRGLLDARRRDHAAAVAARLLRHLDAEAGGAADEVRRAPVRAPGVLRSADVRRARHAQVAAHVASRDAGAQRDCRGVQRARRAVFDPGA